MDERCAKSPQRKFTSPNPIKGLLSLKQVIPFENHPSARGLMKNENEENKTDKILKKENSDKIKFEKRKSDFEISLNTIDEKIYQNEVYFEKNENYSNHNNLSNSIQIPKKNALSEKEYEFDKDITSSIQRNEKSDIIINKFKNFANIKTSNNLESPEQNNES